MRDGTDAVASVHRFQSPNATQIPSHRLRAARNRAQVNVTLNVTSPQQSSPHRRTRLRRRKPFVMRASSAYECAPNR